MTRPRAAPPSAEDALELARALQRLCVDVALDHGLAAGDIDGDLAPVDAAPGFACAEEERLVAGAHAFRRAEFASARRLAHGLLARLGRDGPILRRGDAAGERAPAWPAGSVGSISHAAGLACVVAAPAELAGGLGLDLDVHTALSDDVARVVLGTAERARAARWSGGLGTLAKLVFCVKESAYKLWSPGLSRLPEFDAVDVELEPREGRAESPLTSGRFRARLATGHGAPVGGDLALGRYACERGFVLALCAAPRARASRGP